LVRSAVSKPCKVSPRFKARRMRSQSRCKSSGRSDSRERPRISSNEYSNRRCAPAFHRVTHSSAATTTKASAEAASKASHSDWAEEVITTEQVFKV
jgi:hypothetical protein